MEELYKPKVSYRTRYILERQIRLYKVHSIYNILLDNSLISPTQKSRVDMKLIDCGNYKQVYYNRQFKIVKDKNLDKFKFENPITLISSKPQKKEKHLQTLKQIELKNINRSKYEMLRLVKTNEEDFKTFITLTFAENITSIEDANKIFDIWRTKIKSIKKDFKYICVPEFQKRGAVHYHLLSNLEIEKTYEYIRRNKKLETKLIILQKGKKTQYDVKYWPYGYSSIFKVKNIDVVGYMSKYMTKDIDNRLWGKRRYLYSQNLKKPTVLELDFSNPNDFKIYLELINDNYQLEYEKEYTDFTNTDVLYQEFKKRSDC